MARRESFIQGKIMRWLRSQGYYAVKIISATKDGVPDIITCVDGRFIGIEVKADGNEPTELQQYNRQLIELAGGKFITAYSLEDVQLQIKGYA